jgi:hypothetical protein
MAQTKELTPSRQGRDPFALMREMTSDFDRMFREPSWPSLHFPFVRARRVAETAWSPEVGLRRSTCSRRTTGSSPRSISRA